MTVMDFAAARKNCADWQNIAFGTLDAYKAQHGSSPVMPVVNTMMTTAAGLLNQTEPIAKNEDGLLSPEGVDQLLASQRASAAAKLQDGLQQFDAVLGQHVVNLANKALPQIPAGADESLLRQETQMLVAASENPSTALMNIAQGQRRDLAAVAISPWGASLAGTVGLNPADLAPLRAAAMKGSLQYGTDAQKRAADEYVSATRLAPLREVLNNVVSEVLGVEGTKGVDLHYPLGDAPNVHEWAAAPQGAPPMVKA